MGEQALLLSFNPNLGKKYANEAVKSPLPRDRRPMLSYHLFRLDRRFQSSLYT